MLGVANVGIHNLSPGMCTTDLLMAGAWHGSCRAQRSIRLVL